MRDWVWRGEPGNWVMPALLWAYTALLVGWAVARTLTGDRWTPVLVMAYFGIWLFAPLLIFGPWVVLAGYRPGMGAVGALAVLAAALYWPIVPPRRVDAGTAAVPLTVLTFNTRWDNTAFDALERTLRDADADVLALQEFTDPLRAALGGALQARYPYHVLDPTTALAIYSRYPIVAEDIIPLEIWPAQSVALEVGETTVHLINAHLAPAGVLPLLTRLDAGPARELDQVRHRQIAQIHAAIRDQGGRAIVACDCNMTELTAAHDVMTQGLEDAFSTHGLGLGYTLLAPRGFEVPSPVNVAVQRIDYLFHTPEIDVLRVDVVRGDTGSDHRPVQATFDLRPDGR